MDEIETAINRMDAFDQMKKKKKEEEEEKRTIEEN